MAKARPQLDKMANGKKKPMSRTSGVARRLTKRDEGIATKLKYGAPLTGSASGVKSISLKDAGEVLTSGIVTLGKKGLQADPASLAMALPVGKVLKAARALSAAGKAAQAAPLFARVAAKIGGKIGGRASAVGNAGRGPFSAKNLAKEESAIKGLTGRALSSTGARAASESVFPRLPVGTNLPRGSARTFDIYADPFLQGNERFQGGVVRRASGVYGEARMPRVASQLPKPKLPKGGRTLQLPDNAEARFKAIDRTFSNLGAVRPAVPGAKKVATFPKRVVGKLPEPGSVEMVKKTAKQFGQNVSGKGAKNISRLLKGRGGK